MFVSIINEKQINQLFMNEYNSNSNLDGKEIIFKKRIS